LFTIQGGEASSEAVIIQKGEKEVIFLNTILLRGRRENTTTKLFSTQGGEVRNKKEKKRKRKKGEEATEEEVTHCLKIPEFLDIDTVKKFRNFWTYTIIFLTSILGNYSCH
jgi:hypothetical protein